MFNLLAVSPVVWYVLGGVFLVLFVLILCLLPLKTWFVALVSGAHVSMGRLVGMKIRRINVKEIVDSYIMARKAGLKLDIVELETHQLAGGDVHKVINALISAHSAKIMLTVENAKAIDLAGRDVMEAIKQCVTPKVIETGWISAVAKDGIEIKVKTRITVRTVIQRLVGRAGEETIIARVGEGVVTTVGSVESYQEVLENPDLVSKTVLSKGLDIGTSYEIVSVDIADIDVGQNVGARLLSDDAESKKLVSQAKAEERRVMAIATEQEMKARTQEMKALVLAAEAEVPKAMAEAIRKGQLGVLDYYKLQNLNSDTAMRNAIAGNDKKKKSGGFPE